ncbi:hypothetical protein AB0O22_18625 [Streptomyces sp. NPDC091204]|uniref:hypothetical protein n=1 Tax=Streptomyces sp. NPDC091204 TaxID=3155299 RepID=UPI00344AFB2C
MAVETEHRMAFVPLVLGGVGPAVVTESWVDLSERAGALVLALEPVSVQPNILVSRKAQLTPAADAFLQIAAPPTHRSSL